MGIQINGSTDHITAIDGTIDFVSNIGNIGLITASRYELLDSITIGAGSTIIKTVSGSLGIGLADPATKLEVNSANGTRIRSSYTNTGGGRDAGFDIWADDSGTFAARASLVHSGSGGLTSLYAQNQFKLYSDQSDPTIFATRAGNVVIGSSTKGHADADELTLVGTRTGLTIRSANDNYGNIFFSDATSGTDEYVGGVQYYHADNSLRLKTSSTDRFLIDSSGRIGLGITNPSAYFSSYNRVVMGRPNDTGGMTIVSASDSGGYIAFADGTSGNQAYRGRIIYSHGGSPGDYLRFDTDSTERLRILGDGKVGINTSDPRFNNSSTITANSFYHNDPKLGVQGSIVIGNLSSTATDERELAFYRRNGPTAGTSISTHHLGRIAWYGSSNDTTLPDRAYTIECIPNGGGWTAGSNRRASVQFHNHDSEVMRLTSSGQILIGAGAIAAPKASVGGLDISSGLLSLVVGGEANTGDGTPRTNSVQKEARICVPHYTLAEEPTAAIVVFNQASANRINIGGATGLCNSATDIRFYTAANTTTTGGTERLRIAPDGAVNIGASGDVYNIWNTLAADQNVKLQVRTTVGEPAGIAVLQERGDSNGANLIIGKSRGGSGAGVITSGDQLGWVKWAGADGTRQHNAAGILAWNNGTIATGRVAGNLSFYTSPDAVGSLTERLRITSTGTLHQGEDGTFSRQVGKTSHGNGASKTYSISAFYYGFATFKMAMSDGNYKHAHIHVELGGMQYSAGNGYNATVVANGTGAGPSISLNKQDGAYHITVANGGNSNTLYGSWVLEASSYNNHAKPTLTIS